VICCDPTEERLNLGKWLNLVFLFWLVPQIVWADDALSFETQFHAIQTMRGTFKQIVFSKGQAKHTSSGRMALRRPGQFRWETEEPMAQLVVADGQRLWVYDALLEQVTVRRQAKISDQSAGLFLSTQAGHIAKTYRVVVSHPGSLTQYDLFSKSSHNDFKHVVFQFKQQQLVHLELFDALGQHTEISFQHIETNTPLKSTLFTFKPPKGVDVIDEGGLESA
jgi:outer membrane lipoprotein carrier protein